MIGNNLADTNSVLQSLTLLTFITEILSRQIWQHLTSRMVISKPSGNTVKITSKSNAKVFRYLTFSLENRSNWHYIQILTSISLNLTPSFLNFVKFEVWSFIKRFTAASAKFSKIEDDLRLFMSYLFWKRRTGAYRAIENVSSSISKKKFFF